MSYFVYILKCGDGTYYYGSTSNLSLRLKYHNEGKSQYTKGRLPVKLVYFEECLNKDEALRREKQFKGGRTRKKTIEGLIAAFPLYRLEKYSNL